MSEEEEFSHTGLGKSIRRIGQLYPILVNEKGDVLDGNNRLNGNPTPEKKIIPTKNRYEDLTIRGSAHYRRRVSQEETKNVILEMAREAEKLGTPRNEIAKKIVDDLPYAESYILRLLPDEYKNIQKSSAGKQGADISQQRADEEIKRTEEKARSQIGECHNCHLGFRQDDLSYIDGQPYCLRCAPNAHIAFLKRQKSEEAAKQKPVSPKSLDGPEQKEANMHPHDSQFQIEVFTELAEEGLTFEQNQKLPVFETEPDGLRYLNEDRTEGLIVYLDNVEIHKGKKIDTDDRLRETYVKHHPGIVKLEIPFKGKSDKEKARVKSLIREKYEFLRAEKQKWKTDISQSESLEDS